MQVNLWTFVELFSKRLDSLSHILDIGARHCSACEIPNEEMLGWRLAEDMFPLRIQANIVRNFAVQWPARAAGVDAPHPLEGNSSMAEIRSGIEEARELLAGLRPEQVVGRDAVPIELDLGMIKPTMPLGEWIAGYATTNLLFHLSVAYAILRSNGVALQKPDLFAGRL